jgi:hypothetical protein
LIEGHLAALRKMFLWPAVIMFGTFFLYLVHHAFSTDLKSHDLFGRRSAGMEWYLFAGFTLLLLATPWIGMWMGLLSKTPARAVLATLGLVLILPRFGGCMMIDAIYFAVLWLFARQRVYQKFRQLIAAPVGG